MNDLTKKETAAVTTQEELGSLFAAEAEQGNTGFENVDTTKDVAIPYIYILQAMSPAVKRGPKQITGAEEGNILNTVTREIYKEGIKVVLCAFRKAWVEWIPREAGGGFVAEYPTNELEKSCNKNEKGKMILPNGNILEQTAYHYVVMLHEDGSFERAVIPMVSTNLKKSRAWLAQGLSLTMPNGSTYPMFSQIYKVVTVTEQKDQNTWCTYEASRIGAISDKMLYIYSKKFHDDIRGNLVTISPMPGMDADFVPPLSDEDHNHF